MNERFVQIRKSKGMSQQELAASVGISTSMVSRFENFDKDGPRSPRLRRKLAEAYGVDISEINDACASPSDETGDDPEPSASLPAPIVG